MKKRNPSSTLTRRKAPGDPQPVARPSFSIGEEPKPVAADGVITVCHPVWRLGQGGLERQLVQVTNRLADQRFRHVVVVYGWDSSSEALASQLDPRVRVIRQTEASHDRNSSRRLAAILRDEAVDVVHVRGLSLLLDALMAVELSGNVRLACSFHGFQSTEDEFTGVRKKIVREALLRCNDRWAVGPTAARMVEERLNLPACAFGEINNGVDTDRYTPVASPEARARTRTTLGFPIEKPVMLCLGNLKPIKGQHVLLRAVREMGSAARDLCVVLVGEDGYAGELQAWASANLPRIDIRFIAAQEDPLPWYQAADLFVLPSLSEGLSNALLEAMACGLPAVATNVGGNRDVIQDGRSGRLVAPGDAATTAQALAGLLSNEESRRRLGAAARERAVSAFSVNQMVTGYAARYAALGDPIADETRASPAPISQVKRAPAMAALTV